MIEKFNRKGRRNMKKITVRGVSDQTLSYLTSMAKKRGISFNKLMNEYLEKLALNPQLIEMDTKYKELTSEVIKALHVNTKALQDFNSLNNELFLEEQED